MTVNSRLRKLDYQIAKIIQEMPITYDINSDSLYLQGIEKGIEKVVIRSLQLGMSVEQIHAITLLSLEEIKKIATQLDPS